MACRLMITLEEDEANALARLAWAEMRDPREQVRYWVRQELMRRGALKPTLAPADAESPATTPSNGAPAQDVAATSGGD